MRAKVGLFLAVRGDHDDAALEREAVAVAGGLRDRLSGDVDVVTAVRHPDDPTRRLENAAAMAGSTVTFDLAVLLAGDEDRMDELIGATDGLAERHHDVVDASASAAAAGVEHVIVAGDEPLVHLFALRRLATITNAEFHHHWLTVHSALGHLIPGIGAYNQFHADPELSARAAAAAGLAHGDYDGVAETYCRDLDAFATIMSSAEVAGEGLSDQREFIDASRATAALYRIVR